MAGLLERFLGRVRDRDGQARALEELARPGLPARPDLPGPAAPPSPSDPGRQLHDAVAAKLLDGWLANRQQTLVPHTLNFRALSPGQADLLLSVMAASAQADGQVDPAEARQLPLALRRVGAGEAEARRLSDLLAEPRNLGALLPRVQEEGLAAHAYAAALLAISRRGRANRAFLHYLAARLALAPETAAGLERRYRA